MKKMKRIASLVAVILVVLSLALAMVACGGDEGDTTNTTESTTAPTTSGTTGSSDPNGDDGKEDENPNLVKVTVVDQNNKAIKGATIQICQGDTCFAKPIVTGNDGTGSREYTLNEGKLKAKILAIDGNEDYLVPGEMGYIYFAEGSRELTIKVRKVTVNVFDQNDKAIEGAAVQLYQGEHAFKDLIYTDADGIAYAFVAISGEDLGACVTEILSGGGYELSDDITTFEIGTFEVNVIVNKLSSYSVKISTLFDKAVEGVKVELYDADKGWKLDTAYTDANGIAKFENIEPGSYYAKVLIESPAYKIINESTDGKFMFGSNTVLNIDVVELDTITYTINGTEAHEGLTISVYDKEFNYVDVFASFVDGVVTFDAPNGDYVVIVDYYEYDDKYFYPIFFTKNDSAVGEAKVTEAVAGSSKEYPIYVVGYGSFYAQKGETVWYYIPMAAGKTAFFTSSTDYSFEVSFVDGEEKFVLDSWADKSVILVEDENGGVYFTISLTSEEDDAYISGGVEVTTPGSYSAPIDVNAGENSVTLGGNEIFYKYTATENGTVTIFIPYANANIYSDVFGALIEYTEEGVYCYYTMYEGDFLVFSASAFDENGMPVIVDTTVNITVGEVKKDYVVYTYVDLEAKSGIVVILYKLNTDTYEYEEVARGTTDENGCYVFEGMDFANDSYMVSAVAPENYEVSEGFTYDGTLDGYVYISHERDGSNDYPFGIDHETGEGVINVDANGTTWLEIYVYPSYDGTVFQLFLNSANAQFQVYFGDTNEDGKVDENDTPYGTSVLVDGKAMFTFNDNNRNFKIAISTVNGEAEEISYTYSQKEAEAGSTADSAVEFEEGTGYIADAEAGQTVFFRYTGEMTSLKVEVVGGDVTLKRVAFSISGDYELVDVENNTLVVEDTEGSWIYFVIIANTDTSYEISITAE